MTVIVDYGVGNLFSLKSSFEAVGESASVSSDKNEILSAERIILPGVGAFRDAAAKLKSSGLGEAVVSAAKNGTPLLGICLGMQLLFERSYEFGCFDGLGLIPGEIRPISESIGKGLKIPQIGWNPLIFTNETPIFSDIRDGDCVYFVHSYHAVTAEKYITAKTEYGGLLTASVQNGNVFGCQFHPEKSGRTGLSILKAFTALTV